ncbi:MAG: M50 family metallopeptidase [Chthoniobacterales bacterium]|jgi:Zn-dependent protease
MGGAGIRLFRFAGITVYLHFTWFLIAAYQVQQRIHSYTRPAWALWEYIGLFVMVLLHEFGHALACRSVGGYANRIVLWPLGGVAFVQPPRRPGAMLWSLAAGPLVNVALIPVFQVLVAIAANGESEDLYRLVATLRIINFALLIFNMLPVYPLDGGQILRSLLWYPFGEIRSLQIASVIGLIGGCLLGLIALSWLSLWTAVMAFFLVSRAVAGWQQAKLLVQLEREGRYDRTAPVAPDVEQR